jgi:hypothetical protein
MQLSKNFNLTELISSETALRKKIDNTPSEEVVKNLVSLVLNVLQPLRDKYGKPINITSGYRSPKLNSAIGGAKNSQHCLGQAVDFTVPKEDYKEVGGIIESLFFDQLIFEMSDNGYPRWIHVSFKIGQNRNEILIAYKNAIGQTKYIPYTKKDFDRIYYNLV